MYSFNSRDIVVFLSIIIVLALFFVPVDVENNNLLKNEIVLSNIEVFDCSTGELVSLDSDSGEYPEKVDIRVGVTENHVFLEGVGLLDVDGIIGPKIIIDDDLKQKIEQDTNIVVNDLVWVETNGFVPENTGGKIILSSIGQKTFKCDGTVDNPDCFEIDSCSVSEKPCYEFDSGNTIVYVNHFSGAFNTLTWTTDADWDGGIYTNTSSELGSLGLCWEGGAYCGWDYRKPINVSAISALTDYQVNISVTWDSDMQDNFEDMRFTYYNETSGTETQIPYWFESNTAQTNAIVWFKTNLISGYNTVYMYYGNATATSESNGTDTFVFFTSFEDGTLGDWVQYNPSYPATISTEWASDGIYSAKIVKPSAHTDCGINLVGVETGSIRIILDAKHSSGSNAGLYLRSPVGTQILTSVGEVTDWTITWDVATPYTVQLTSIQYTPAEPMTGYYDRIRGIYYTATPPTTSFGAEQIPPTTGQYTSNTTDTLETISRLKATWNAIDSWKYKKEINISNTGSALADYQVKMVIDKEIDMNSNYSDLRFTDNTANLLNYWIEENNTVNATVWVKANLSASTNTTIYMYYGNPSAISESSSIPVILNDDFGTTDLIDGTNAASLGYTWTAYNGDPWGVDNYYLTNVPTQGISYLEKDFGEVIPYKKLETQYVWGGTTTGVTATTQAWTGSSWENIGSITSFDAGVYTYTVPDNTSKIKIWKVESHDNGLVINYWKFLPFTAATEPTISFISSQMSGDLSVEFSADGINWLTVSNNTNYITGGGIGSGTNLQYRVNVAELNSSQSPKLHDITLEYETGFNSCGILSIENGIYLLENDVSSAGTCFTIAADNITLDCQSNMINYSQSEVGYGIDVDSGFDNVTIKNCNIVQGSETEDSYAVYLSSSWDSLLLNNTITTVGDSSYGIYFSNSKNNTVYNTELIVVDEIDIYVRGTGSYKNHIINSTFDEDEIYFESEDSGSIEVLWYFDVYVNDSLGNPIGDANVTVWQTDGTIEFSMLTDSFGNIETQVLMEFIQNNTDKYVIDYVMNITKAGYVSDSKIIILSNYQFINVALLVNNPPQITIDSPLNSLYNHQAIWFNISVVDDWNSIDWCGYSLNGSENVTMSNDSMTHFSFLNDTVYVGSYDLVFYCNDSYGVLNSTDKIYFEVLYECMSDLECSASGDICLYNGCVSEGCTDYCTTNVDLICNSDCDGVKGCQFFGEDTKTFCDGKSYGQWFDYGGGQVINCCEGAPTTSYEPDVIYAGLNPLTVALGDVADVVVSIRNRNDFEDTFTVSLESASNLKYWSWFATHKNDKERMSMDVSFKPYEQKFISIKVLGATDGCFKGGSSLGINVTTSLGKSEKEYVEVCMVPSKTSRSSSRNVPGLSGVGFVVLVLMSLVVYYKHD